MEFFATPSFDWYYWVILPIMIFCARIFDVSIGTLRIIMISRGHKKTASTLGFFEVLIWITVISQVLGNVSSFMINIFYAGGFAAGTYIGMLIESKLSRGQVLIQITARKNSDKIVTSLRKEKFRVTVIDGHGKKGPIKILYTVVDKKRVDEAIKIVNEHNNMAFYTIEELKNTRDKIPKSLFPNKKHPIFRFSRPGK